jgi:hypothetical protein
MGAARVRQTVHIDVVEPGPERQLDLGLTSAALQEHGAVNVNFSMHAPLRETLMLCRERSDFNPAPQKACGRGR